MQVRHSGVVNVDTPTQELQLRIWSLPCRRNRLKKLFATASWTMDKGYKANDETMETLLAWPQSQLLSVDLILD